MELASRGDLEQYISIFGPFRETGCRDYVHMIFRQLLDAVAYLHRRNIVHRDIKCENILLDHHWNAKLADFGFAREMEPEELSRTHCGSTAYVAPEILSTENYAGAPTDMWSVGVVLFIALTGRMPFDDSNIATMVQRQMADELPFPHWPVASREAQLLIRTLLQPAVNQRPTATQALNSLWIKQTPYFNRPALPDTSNPL